MSTENTDEGANIRVIDKAEVDVVSGGSIFGMFMSGFSHTVTSPRDAASGLATGKRAHKPIIL